MPDKLNIPRIGDDKDSIQRAFDAVKNFVSKNKTYLSGKGSPEGKVAAETGSLYTDENGGANTTLWVKETGDGNTGWKAVDTLSIVTTLGATDTTLPTSKAILDAITNATRARDYAWIRMSADQASAGSGDTLNFNTLDIGNMTFDTVNHKVLLKANRTYKMLAQTLYEYTSATDQSLLVFYDLTNSAYLNGMAYNINNAATNKFGGAQPAMLIIKPTTDIYVCIKSYAGSVVKTVYGGIYSSWIIEEIFA